MQSDRQFAGSIPALYDRYLGPLIFTDYAADLARRAAALAPERVLETAAGTGIVTRALAQALPRAMEIVATDLNQPMLDYAAAQPGVEKIAWRRSDAQSLPFADASFDAVVCQFGVMFFPDRLVAYREVRRILKPGGCFLFNVWDRIEENKFAAVVSVAMSALFPADPPGFLARTPHGYHDVAVVTSDLRRSGFGRVEIETLAKRSRAASALEPAIGFCEGTPLRSEIEARAPGRLGEATDAAAVAIAAQFGEGPVDGKIRAHVFTAAP